MAGTSLKTDKTKTAARALIPAGLSEKKYPYITNMMTPAKTTISLALEGIP